MQTLDDPILGDAVNLPLIEVGAAREAAPVL